jgi:hypothetical protein
MRRNNEKQNGQQTNVLGRSHRSTAERKIYANGSTVLDPGLELCADEPGANPIGTAVLGLPSGFGA